MSAFEKPQIIAHIQKGLNYTVFDCKWVPCSAKFVTMGNFARGTGVIQLYEIQHGDLKLLREIEKAKPIKCGTFGATSLQQRYLATGDFAGNLHIWNLEAPEIPVYSVKGHKEIINTIDGVGGLGIGEGAPEIVTGSRDGNAYNQEERVVCAGYDNGDIKLFDLRSTCSLICWDLLTKVLSLIESSEALGLLENVPYPLHPTPLNTTWSDAALRLPTSDFRSRALLPAPPTLHSREKQGISQSTSQKVRSGAQLPPRVRGDADPHSFSTD
ncbi:WD repeat-containing protein 92 [Camelus ferus]|nr:WD repeat-containing protein 92 [Camelus ferus]